MVGTLQNRTAPHGGTGPGGLFGGSREVGFKLGRRGGGVSVSSVNAGTVWNTER